MADPDFSKDFFLRLNNGRDSAVNDVVRRYQQQLCALVEREMGKRLAAREDPDDAVQSAMASFCRGVRDGRLVIDNAGKLWGLLISAGSVAHANAEGNAPTRAHAPPLLRTHRGRIPYPLSRC